MRRCSQGEASAAGGGDALRAALGHALAFGTWRSLALDQELGDEDAVELMSRLVAAAAR